MSLLDRINHEYCRDKYGLTYDTARFKNRVTLKDEEEMSKRYAKEILERAAENAKVKQNLVIRKGQVNGLVYTVDKESILNVKLN